MSGALKTWYSSRDLDACADRRTVLEAEIGLGSLERLAALLASDAGPVEARVAFGPRSAIGWPVELGLKARLRLTCQRCLEPLDFGLDSSTMFVLVESEALVAHVPEETEAVVLDQGRWLPMETIEDELIVSLPLAPRHEDTSDCGRLAAAVGAASGQRPPAASDRNH